MIMVFIGFLSETQIIAPQCNHHQTVPQFAQYMNVMVGIQILFYFDDNGVYVIWPYYLTRYCLTPTTQVTQMPLPITIVQPRVARTSLSDQNLTYINLFKVSYIYIYIYTHTHIYMFKCKVDNLDFIFSNYWLIYTLIISHVKC